MQLKKTLTTRRNCLQKTNYELNYERVLSLFCEKKRWRSLRRTVYDDTELRSTGQRYWLADYSSRGCRDDEGSRFLRWTPSSDWLAAPGTKSSCRWHSAARALRGVHSRGRRWWRTEQRADVRQVRVRATLTDILNRVLGDIDRMLVLKMSVYK